MKGQPFLSERYVSKFYPLLIPLINNDPDFLYKNPFKINIWQSPTSVLSETYQI